ncbi:hypothetical protein HPP92_020137 [Vanilla planifolia]|uniref:Uncharacterized protein n=1 Tax=Vanilla planifolia TaxID=51239 RepID=A0A835Q3L1_VANPL|nr:hypothetical protein HPP92_020137 [Vanilla planifolia]
MSTKGGRKARLSLALDSHTRSIKEMFQILEKSAARSDSSLKKVEWSQVMKLGDEVSKQATAAGILWSGEVPNIKQLEENMEAYFNVLHGFLLHCHGSTVGAGITLHTSIRASAKQVVDTSLALLKEAVNCESSNSSKRSSIPQLSGCVWEACASLKKTPSDNYTAIGRAITHVAVSVKDVLREMNELKPAVSNSSPDEDDGSGDDEFGNDLSPEEMIVAQLATKSVSCVLLALKEVIRYVSNLLKLKNEKNESLEHVDSLERLLSCCKEMGTQANEFGASVYPPQEISLMKASIEKMYTAIDEMQKVFDITGSPDEGLLASFKELESSVKKLESCLGDSVNCEMERLAL